LNIRTPGQKSFDLALGKRIRVGERVAAEFRCELYNAFNWVNFGAPASNVSTSAFGTITTTTTAPRVIQLAIKVSF
jgi:hypothetical protein